MPRLGAQYKGDRTRFGVFHPVILGLHPVSQIEGGSTSMWRKRRAIILKMHDYCCAYCGDEANTVDHVIPMSKGGTDDPNNLVAACSNCNYKLGNKTKVLTWLVR